VSEPRGITLEDLRAVREPTELTRIAIAELEAEQSRGCTCTVELFSVQVLEGDAGSILTLVHELDCPRWQSATS
jgi:hypothetical protein